MNQPLVYPVHLMAQSNHIWLAWRSADEPTDAILKIGGEILWATTKHSLRARCLQIYDDPSFEDEVHLDLDALLISLANKAPISSDEVINCWNMLIDVGNVLPSDQASSFRMESSSLLASYDRFFSASSGGEVLEFDADEITNEDRNRAIEVISTGIVMLLNATVGKQK